MNRNIYSLVQQGLLDFLGEKTLSPYLMKRNVSDAVALCFDVDDLNRGGALQPLQFFSYVVGLPTREVRAARADSNKPRWWGHDRRRSFGFI